MASTIGTLLVRLGIDAGGYVKGLDAATKQTTNNLAKIEAASKALSNIGTKLTMGVTLPLLGIGAAAVKAASDTAESLNKVQSVFGATSASITDFAKNAARDFGMTKAEVYDATSTFGNMFQAMGMGTKPAADLSKNLVSLAADMASFHNIGTEQAFEKLRAGLVGESEPLRQLGIMLDADTTKAKALAMGLADANGEVSNAALVQARYALIIEQSSKVLGDREKTEDSFANQLRTTQKNMFEVASTLGTVLLPKVNDAIGEINDLAEAFAGMDKSTQNLIVNLGLVAVAAGPALKALGLLHKTIVLIGTSAAMSTVAVYGLATAGAALLVLGLKELGSIPHEMSAAAQAAINSMVDPGERLIDLSQRIAAAQAEVTKYPDNMDVLKAYSDLTKEMEVLKRELAATGVTGPKALHATGDAAIDLAKSLGTANKYAETLEETMSRLSMIKPSFGGFDPSQPFSSAPFMEPGGDPVAAEEERFRTRLAGITSARETEEAKAKEVNEKIRADNLRTVDAMKAAYQRAWERIKGFASDALAGANSTVEKLLQGTPFENMTGGMEDPNGPFRDLRRAVDVAVNGAASPWGAGLGLDQTGAQQIIKDFRAGNFDNPDLQKLLEPALIAAAQQAASADSSRTSFLEGIAKKTGLDMSGLAGYLGGPTQPAANAFMPPAGATGQGAGGVSVGAINITVTAGTPTETTSAIKKGVLDALTALVSSEHRTTLAPAYGLPGNP